MENRYCQKLYVQRICPTVSNLSSLYNFSELCILERLSESILSRYARELAMEQLFAWMASRITSNCLLICCRWSAWQLGLGAFNSWKVQKPAKLGMSQIVTAVFESCLGIVLPYNTSTHFRRLHWHITRHLLSFISTWTRTRLHSFMLHLLLHLAALCKFIFGWIDHGLYLV